MLKTTLLLFTKKVVIVKNLNASKIIANVFKSVLGAQIPVNAKTAKTGKYN